MTFFTYNGRSSADFGLHIESKNIFSAPSFDMSFQTIPGRNGDLIIHNNRYANLTVSYTVFLVKRNVGLLADKLQDIKGWLYTQPDRYHPITDSYDTEFIRYGVIKEGLDIEEQLNRVGCFTVLFSCKPFRYSRKGSLRIPISNSGDTLYNPFPFASRPLIHIQGSGVGQLTVQAAEENNTWEFSGIDGYVDADSEQMNFYKGSRLLNNTVTGSGFPLLYPGDNVFYFFGGITNLIVSPRWCTL